MNIPMIDVTLRLKENLDVAQLNGLEASLHDVDGVISTHVPLHNAHMMLVELNPDRTSGEQLAAHLARSGIHAEVEVPERL